MCLHVLFNVRWNVYILKVLMMRLTRDFFVLFSKCEGNDHREKGLEYI